jgi:hypothetical protein
MKSRTSFFCHKGGRGCVLGGFGKLCSGVVAFEGDIYVCVFENIGDFSDLW